MDVSLDYTIDTDKIFKVGVCRLDFRTAEYPEQYVLANIYKNFNDDSIEYKLMICYHHYDPSLKYISKSEENIEYILNMFTNQLLEILDYNDSHKLDVKNRITYISFLALPFIYINSDNLKIICQNYKKIENFIHNKNNIIVCFEFTFVGSLGARIRLCNIKDKNKLFTDPIGIIDDSINSNLCYDNKPIFLNHTQDKNIDRIIELCENSKFGVNSKFGSNKSLQHINNIVFANNTRRFANNVLGGDFTLDILNDEIVVTGHWSVDGINDIRYLKSKIGYYHSKLNTTIVKHTYSTFIHFIDNDTEIFKYNYIGANKISLFIVGTIENNHLSYGKKLKVIFGNCNHFYKKQLKEINIGAVFGNITILISKRIYKKLTIDKDYCIPSIKFIKINDLFKFIKYNYVNYGNKKCTNRKYFIKYLHMLIFNSIPYELILILLSKW